MSHVMTSPLTEFTITGTVKWFDPGKGFGFIEPETGGNDVLLHVNVLRKFGVNSVSEGSYLRVSVRHSDQGDQAFEVQEINPPASLDEVDHEIVLAQLDTRELVPARIKWYSREKGYGFANVYGRTEDVFIGGTVLRSCGLAEVQEGEAVCLRVTQGEKGQVASHVVSWATAQQDDDDDARSQPIGKLSIVSP